MGQAEVLLTFVDLFRRFQISYLLTGSIAVGVYGFPRATHDIDFMIVVGGKEQNRLFQGLRQLDKSYVMDRNLLKEDILQRKQFDIYNTESGIKIDFWMLPQKVFAQQYNRRQQVTMHKRKIYLAGPEDIILTKLTWCKEIYSERHFRDCVGIVHVQGKKLDRIFLKKQASLLGIEKLLNDVFTTKNY